MARVVKDVYVRINVIVKDVNVNTLIFCAI